MRMRRCSGLSTRNSPPNDQKAWPPSEPSGSWSTTITRRPASASWAVATSPASPPPTTMTSASAIAGAHASRPGRIRAERCLWRAMGHQMHHSPPRGFWPLVKRQHGVVTRAQLLALGFSGDAIKHRIAKGRLHPVARGVYAVGRQELTRHGRWMAAVLSCGPGAVLSHASAAALWEMVEPAAGRFHISVPGAVRRRSGVVVHRRSALASDATSCQGIPVTSPLSTLVDLASMVGRDHLEAAINAADRRDLVDPEAIREGLAMLTGRRGVARLRATLDRRTFTLTD